MIYKKIAIKVDGYKETADLYTYFLDNSIEMNINRKRPVVVICPGGGYTMTSDREAEPIAMQYLAKGYHAVILRYSVEPARYPLALLQLAKSVAFLSSPLPNCSVNLLHHQYKPCSPFRYSDKRKRQEKQLDPAHSFFQKRKY